MENNKDPNKINPLKILFRKYGFIGSIKTIFQDVVSDYIKGIDTYKTVDKDELFTEDLREVQNRYLPSTYDAVEKSILLLLSVDSKLEKENFIDFGSGKAKVLIGASKFPFNQLKGIEFNSGLHQIATKNIEKLKLGNRIKLYNGDACNLRLENNDRVLYFFNPFSGIILEKCLQNIVAQKTKGNPRYIIYVNPTEDNILSKYLSKIGEYKIKPGNISVNLYHD